MELYFLRHGVAADRSSSGTLKDSERPLLPEGIKKMKSAAKGMKKMGLSFDKVFSSPYLRAKETAQIVVQTLEFSEKIIFTEAMIPSAGYDEFEGLLRTIKKENKALFVGHEPSISAFISHLISGGPDANIEMKKGALCRVDVEDPSHVIPGRLKWLMASRQLRGLA